MNNEKIKGTHNGLTRIQEFTIEEVFDWIKDNNTHVFWEENGYSIKPRMFYRARIYSEKGMICGNCGLTGTYFALEKDKGGGMHLDLYGKNETGDVMFTIDHIKPSSKGGKHKMDNFQTMCKVCNEKKADDYEQLIVNNE
jgi:5-methylcytosine-specific restriction endonuclease McrA